MLLEILKRHVNECPHEIGFVIGGKEVSWSDLKLRVDSFAKMLETFKNQRVLFYVDGRTVDDIALLIASSNLGECLLVSSFHKPERALEFMADFNCHVMFATENGRLKILGEREVIESGRPSVSEGNSVCLLTSGSTGKPKCVRQSWNSLSASVVLNPKFRNRKWLMGYHITNFAGTQVFLQSYINGGCLVIPNSFAPGVTETLETIETFAVQYLNCTPTYARNLLLSLGNRTINSVRSITLGGEIVDQALINSLKAKFPNVKITHIYASTELGASFDVTDECEGFPLELVDNVKMKIVDGELLVRPTAKSMIGYLDGAGRPKDWVSTGDLVEVKGGRVLFVGRKDLMINVGGFKVIPEQVELVIRGVEGVMEVVVLSQKNPVTGNLIKARVQLGEGLDEAQMRTKIIEVCKQKLSYYSVPRLFEFIEQPAITSSFKLKR